jgi:hypothetical protein
VHFFLKGDNMSDTAKPKKEKYYSWHETRLTKRVITSLDEPTYNKLVKKIGKYRVGGYLRELILKDLANK